ncbi:MULTISPECIES: dienelactone hydrolase family protein [Streptomyces]|uniref:Alpha/beta hydrolase n=1 Tax=Streptomyces doudnae TaxID=3075536 RepID=A0ABD5ELA8_9ACTN|nr:MULTISPECIES: alpha/beta hydrolase [unclassified Streptomyces]MDT0435078.1 alpha/beta hydrolase [Streptomyces sp. DSM 41981]MYQ68247.1 alpha/beta hydrolase [Streptomyces sp. SID4950]SCE44387.1 Dienelactone hydrolase [Streptomyces sp. SolWspMP-5a-2]
MRFTSERRLEDGVLVRDFTLGEIRGTLWTPASAAPAPLILTAHNNGLPRHEPRLVARARRTAAHGYTVASIDAAGCGDRPRSAADEQARADLRRAMRAGEPVDDIFESFIAPLVEKATPEWRTTLDALLELPGIDGPVGYSGWTAVGIHLAATDPRVTAASLFTGGYVPSAQREEARSITIPLLLLLQWDDEGNPRDRALTLFDTFESKEKTLHANTGGHTGTPWFETEDALRFFDRHLKRG